MVLGCVVCANCLSSSCLFVMPLMLINRMLMFLSVLLCLLLRAVAWVVLLVYERVFCVGVVLRFCACTLALTTSKTALCWT